MSNAARQQHPNVGGGHTDVCSLALKLQKGHMCWTLYLDSADCLLLNYKKK